MSWIRIGDYTECSICGHKGFCMISSDGKYICCARIESPIRLGDAGYIHPNKSGVKIHRPATKRNKDTWKKVWEGSNHNPDFRLLAKQLDIDCSYFNCFDIRHCPTKLCYLMAMEDGCGNIVGIQERYLNGTKKATTGSKLGLFIPAYAYYEGHKHADLVICEGFSDAVTMMSEGFMSIGRPSCSTGTHEILTFLGDNKFDKIYIAADGDKVGVNGAVKLRKAMQKHFDISVTVIIPPPGIKDVRQWRKKNNEFAKNFLATTEF